MNKQDSILALVFTFVLVVCVMAIINGTYVEALGILLIGGPFTGMSIWMLSFDATEKLTNEEAMVASQIPLHIELPKPLTYPDIQTIPSNRGISDLTGMWDSPFHYSMSML